MEYLVVPGQAVEAQPTPSGISTLQIQTVQVKTGQNPGGVVYDPCKMKETETCRHVLNFAERERKSKTPTLLKVPKVHTEGLIK